MNLSMRWLADYVQPNVSMQEFSDGMTMSGSKVESFEQEGGELKNIVVGKVSSVDKHPNADSLVICQIDVGGSEDIQIVTGAKNVTPGSFVPVAMDNSVVHGGKAIKKGKLRGEVSMGMLCSLEELGLTTHDFPYAIEDGIFILEESDITPGQQIQEAIGLNDTVVEFEITSNRPDCMSVIGLARETAATFDATVSIPQPRVKGCGGDVNSIVKVEIQNPKLCQRYAAAAVQNVRIAPSPRWLRERLRASGVRPINNIVDITNYVMLEYGHPMHAFDLKHVKGSHIIVRNAAENEAITTLDGTERKLTSDMLVIADEQSPSAVAGVMGGEFSGVYDDTNTVIFESACFDGASVRTTAKALGMRTESSGRFEKGLDPETCLPALRRACELVELLGAGDVVDGIVDIYPTPSHPTTLPLDVDKINELLGIELSANEMSAILKKLDFKVEHGQVTAPTFRSDIHAMCDLSEEIARMYGYNNIPTTGLRGSVNGVVTPSQQFEKMCGRILLAQGFSEIITYSFISPKYYDNIGLASDDKLRKSVEISNPLGEDTSVMRTTAVPSMLEVLARNYRSGNAEAMLYEIATEYTPTETGKLPNEDKRVILGMYGGEEDFFTLKGAVEALLQRNFISGAEFEATTDNGLYHPGRCATLTIDGKVAGILGEIHPAVADNYDMSTRVYVAQLDLATMFEASNPVPTFSQLPRYPASTRDLALICDDTLPVRSIEKAISEAVGVILEKLTLFDVYRGAQIGEGKKSVAYSLVLRASDRTLTDQECDSATKKALKALAKIDVELRS